MRNKMKLYGKRCLSLLLVLAMIVPVCSSYITRVEAADTTASQVSSSMVNLALNKTVTASSYWDNGTDTYAPAQVVDGDTSTRWASKSGGDNEWLQIDLGQSEWLVSAGLQYQNNNGIVANSPSTVEIQVSNDKSEWETVVASTACPARGSTTFSSAYTFGEPTYGRYVRFQFTECSGAGVTEAEVYGLENLAQGKEVEASSYYNKSSIVAPAKVVDGDTSTRWSAQNDTEEQWLEINLEQATWLGTVEINHYSKNLAQSVTIQVRENESDDWTTVISKGATQAGVVSYIFSEAVYGRYVRLLFEDGGSNSNIAITEVRVFGYPYVLKEVDNGSLTVSFSEALTDAPTKNDFTLFFSVDERTINPNITKYSYDAEKKEATFQFEPIGSAYQVERNVEVSVSYGDIISAYANGQFVIPAGTNQAPTVSDVEVVNITPELSEQPCSKGMLKVSYSYADPEGDVEGETDYQWYIADEKEGNYEPIPGIRTKTIILLDDYVGKYLKCEVIPVDVNGGTNLTATMSSASEAVQATEGNPLTDWFLEAQMGVSHHFISYFVTSHSQEEAWNPSEQTWNEYVGEFDAEAYAEQLSKTPVKYVLFTLGQNSSYYCAPNEVYDKYMREAGLIDEGEDNPKTVSYENDLPMKLANALEKYDIKLMLYLPSNHAKAAHWDDTAADYIITEQVFKSDAGQDHPVSQEAMKIHCEMVQWWSEHYGDKIAGWWFDGMFHDLNETYGISAYDMQHDMTQKYNVSSLVNAAKAGNPYSIVAIGGGTDTSISLGKNTIYNDYTPGEVQGFYKFPVDGRWATDTDDCQNFQFGPLGTSSWGSGGVRYPNEYLLEQALKSIEKSYVLGFDVKVNHVGVIDEGQFEQLVWLKENLENGTQLRENLALNKGASASSCYNASYDASKVVDGDYDSRWSAYSKISEDYSNNVGEWLEIDLEQSKWVGSVDINYFVKNTPKSVTIQMRTNADDEWETIISKAETPAQNTTDKYIYTYIFEEAVYGRYVRLLFEDGGNDNNIAITEVKVYEAEVNQFVGMTVNLDGQIGLNFYVPSSHNLSNDAYVKFDLEKGGEQTVAIADAVETDYGIKFTCLVPAKEMADTVTATLYDKGEVKDTQSTSVREYAQKLMEQEAAITDESYKKATSLVEAMLHYGAYAQKYFKYNTTDLANSILTYDEDTLLGSVSAQTLSDAGFSKEKQSVEGVATLAGASLILKGETTLRMFFTVDQDVSNLTFYVNGVEQTPVASGDYYVVELKNIAANQLSTDCTVRVTDGTNELVATCSAMTFCYNALQNTDTKEALQQVAKVLYLYSKQADTYFGQ